MQTFEQQVSFQLTGAKATQGMHKVQEIKSKKLALNITKNICTQHVNIRKNYTPKKSVDKYFHHFIIFIMFLV